MKVGQMDLNQIEKDYYKIDRQIIGCNVWELYEHRKYGENVEAIALNLTQNFYTYTYESLSYTVQYLDSEYFSELYSL